MKRMLINATQSEELRVALVDGQKLYDLDIEPGNREQKKSNIYKGKITRVEPSLEAAFVDFGAERHGFLPLKEISREYFSKDPGPGRINIKDVIKEGQQVIVQVDKEERGNKGAALTTQISLAGRYLVLMPNNPRAGGISRRIEGEDRNQLRDAMKSVQIPDRMGVIVRTAGIGRSSEELQADLDYLANLWGAITRESENRQAPCLLLQESNVVIRAIRDYLRQDIGEVLIDSEDAFKQAIAFVDQVMPQFVSKFKRYSDPVPLFNRYQIENQIESAFQREVKLPSGGSIVIDPTEALVSIDINSSRATKGADIEETAVQTNCEAAEEIARQLRLRDMGGLVVIDFIDMMSNKNQREVENRLKKSLEIDRARVQVGRISRFGLMEMSRQRLRPSLDETSAHVCPRCNGTGVVRDIQSTGLSILRLIEEEAAKENTGQIRAIVPVAIASFLLNEKRSLIAGIEQRHGSPVMVIPNPHMDTPHYEVMRLRNDDSQLEEVSFEQDYTHIESEYLNQTVAAETQQAQVAAVKPIDLPKVKRATPATATATTTPKAVAKEAVASPGLLAKAGQFFVSLFESDDKTPQAQPAKGKAKGKAAAQERNNKNRSNAKQTRDTRSNQRSKSRNTKTTTDGRDQTNSRNDRSDKRENNTDRRQDDNRDRNRNRRRKNTKQDAPAPVESIEQDQGATKKRAPRRDRSRKVDLPEPVVREEIAEDIDTSKPTANKEQAATANNAETVNNAPASESNNEEKRPRRSRRRNRNRKPNNDQTASTETTDQAETPVEAQAPAKTEAPAKSEASAKTETPVKTETAVKSETTVKAEAPAKPEASAKTETPVTAKTTATTESSDKAPVEQVTNSDQQTAKPVQENIAESNVADKTDSTAEKSAVEVTTNTDDAARKETTENVKKPRRSARRRKTKNETTTEATDAASQNAEIKTGKAKQPSSPDNTQGNASAEASKTTNKQPTKESAPSVVVSEETSADTKKNEDEATSAEPTSDTKPRSRRRRARTRTRAANDPRSAATEATAVTSDSQAPKAETVTSDAPVSTASDE